MHQQLCQILLLLLLFCNVLAKTLILHWFCLDETSIEKKLLWLLLNFLGINFFFFVPFQTFGSYHKEW